MPYSGFERHALDDTHCLWRGQLPEDLLPGDPSFELVPSQEFEAIWDLHPNDYHDVKMGGRWVKTPRWQQAYNKDYAYTGSRNNAQPVPAELQPYWNWSMAQIDDRLNGILLNWYDGTLGHYIGRHRDKANDLVVGTPIVTISLGESRVFRMRPWRGSGFQDFPADHGTVFILPWDSNFAFTHEVPHSKKHTGRRISITIRAFES